MSVATKLRGGALASIKTAVLASKEVVVGTDHNRLIVGDGVKAGGHTQALKSDVARLAFTVRNVDLTVLGDVPVTITLPNGYSLYFVSSATAENATAQPFSTPNLALRSGAGGTGLFLCTTQNLSNLFPGSGTPASYYPITGVGGGFSTALNLPTLYWNKSGTVGPQPCFVDLTLVVGLLG